MDRQITSALTGFQVTWAYSGHEGLALLPLNSFDAAVVNAPLTDYPPEGMLEEIARLDSRPAILIRNREGNVAEAVRCVKLGATQYFGPDALNCGQEVQAIQQALEAAVSLQSLRYPKRMGPGIAEEPWRKFLVGHSKAMRGVAQVIRLVGTRRCTVLVTGETGTGKELAARAIHMASSRSAGPLIAVNCSAIPENLLEAELFAMSKGPSPVRPVCVSGVLKKPIGAHCFWMKSRICPTGCRPSCCAFCRKRRFSGWAAVNA